MNLIVCVKQVPNTTEVRIDPKTNTLIREGIDSILNPFDAYALEEAVRIKEEHGGTVTVLTMGPPQAEQVLREAISVGADKAVLLSDPAFAGADTLATSYTLARAIHKLEDFQLILCGKQAIDGDTAQVGPGIAVHLGLPQIIFVRRIREVTGTELVAERMTETGFEAVRTKLPALVTVVKDINQPRLPSLRGKMTAAKAVIPVWTAKDLNLDAGRIGLQGSPTWVRKIFSPPPRSGGKRFEGEPAAVVDEFIHALKDDGML